MREKRKDTGVKKRAVEHRVATSGDVRDGKVGFVKSGAGNVTPRCILPITFTRALGITEDLREITLEFTGDSIIIKKK